MDRVSHSRMSSRARPLVAAALLALLCALVLSVAPAHALEVEEEPPLDPNAEPPSFVVIQTDDQTLDELYASFTPFPGATAITVDAEHARPARQARRDLQPLLRLLPALLPLAGQPADRPLRAQHRRQGQRAAQRRLLRLLLPRRLQPQPRHLAAGRRLPHDPHRQVPQRLRRRTVQTTAPPCRPAGTPGTRYSMPTPTTTSTATRSTTTASSANRMATRGPGNRANTPNATPPAAPSPPKKGDRASTRPTSSTGWHGKKCSRRPQNSRSTSSSTTPRPTATSASPPGPSRRRATTTGSRAQSCRMTAPKGSTRATSATSRRFIREAEHLTPERHAHVQGLLREGAGVAALDRRRGQRDRRHARPAAPTAQHLHPLHLRQRLLLRRAPADRRQVPRLRAGHAPALPDPRTGDQARQLDR